MRYLVWGEEICPKTQKPHLQGYVEFHHAHSRTAMQAIFAQPTLHMEDRMENAGPSAGFARVDPQSKKLKSQASSKQGGGGCGEATATSTIIKTDHVFENGEKRKWKARWGGWLVSSLLAPWRLALGILQFRL
mmetsp:Transcript_28889/g.72291  ORF Transcript_28889/g.72291 Transcript_28889/m.72291 type:complete len:133 (-) Transcript_28889:103-501(-)